jgi:hypothetical protein
MKISNKEAVLTAQMLEDAAKTIIEDFGRPNCAYIGHGVFMEASLQYKLFLLFHKLGMKSHTSM